VFIARGAVLGLMPVALPFQEPFQRAARCGAGDHVAALQQRHVLHQRDPLRLPVRLPCHSRTRTGHGIDGEPDKIGPPGAQRLLDE
jgi:hypothetical protein